MRKLTAYLLVVVCLLVSVLPLGGCGIKKKAERAVTEKIVEKALGDNVDIKGDTVTVTGENGAVVTFGGGQWPETELAKKVPKFTKGNIVTSASEEDSMTVFMGDVKAEDFEAYLAEIKKTYTQDAFESKNDGVIVYGGSDGEITVAVNYVTADGAMGITVTK
jgi:hypothetical protein